MLADPGQIDLLKEVLSFVSQSERDILKKLADLRDEIEEAKRKEKHLKKAIERSMKQGFKITTR